MNLDSQQIKAVKTDSKKVLVLAGAGSGKTRVLIERIADLVEHKKVSPYEILAFTFTRKAAGEIRSRLEDRIGNASYQCTLGTIHAIALKMIYRFGESIGFKSQHSTVYSEWESEYLLKEVAIELGIFDKSWKIPKKKIIDPMFAEYYQNGNEPDEDHPGYGLFKTFIARCKENNALTYGALLIGLEMLIPTLAKYLHIRHILIDETQDNDGLQWRISNKLCGVFNASLFVVGDVSQSVYQWRGAMPEYLVDHQHEFDIYRLETNYRSLPDIVNPANDLIRNNKLRLPLEMKSARNMETN